jgi:hypothetical protein
VRKMYNEWMCLLDELLIVPGHQVNKINPQKISSKITQMGRIS